MTFLNQQKNILFPFELEEKVLENNKNSGKIKIQNCCEPCIMVSSVSNALYLVHFNITDSNFSDASKYVLTKGHSDVFNNFSQI